MNDKIFLQINNLKELFYVIWYNRLISYWNWIDEFQNNNYEKYKLYLKYSELRHKHKNFAKLFSFLEWVLISKWDRDDSSFYYKLQEFPAFLWWIWFNAFREHKKENPVYKYWRKNYTFETIQKQPKKSYCQWLLYKMWVNIYYMKKNFPEKYQEFIKKYWVLLIILDNEIEDIKVEFEKEMSLVWVTKQLRDWYSSFYILFSMYDSFKEDIKNNFTEAEIKEVTNLNKKAHDYYDDNKNIVYNYDVLVSSNTWYLTEPRKLNSVNSTYFDNFNCTEDIERRWWEPCNLMTKEEIKKLFEDNLARIKNDLNEFRYRRFSWVIPFLTWTLWVIHTWQYDSNNVEVTDYFKKYFVSRETNYKNNTNYCTLSEFIDLSIDFLKEHRSDLVDRFYREFDYLITSSNYNLRSKQWILNEFDSCIDWLISIDWNIWINWIWNFDEAMQENVEEFRRLNELEEIYMMIIWEAFERLYKDWQERFLWRWADKYQKKSFNLLMWKLHWSLMKFNLRIWLRAKYDDSYEKRIIEMLNWSFEDFCDNVNRVNLDKLDVVYNWKYRLSSKIRLWKEIYILKMLEWYSDYILKNQNSQFAKRVVRNIYFSESTNVFESIWNDLRSMLDNIQKTFETIRWNFRTCELLNFWLRNWDTVEKRENEYNQMMNILLEMNQKLYDKWQIMKNMNYYVMDRQTDEIMLKDEYLRLKEQRQKEQEERTRALYEERMRNAQQQQEQQ